MKKILFISRSKLSHNLFRAVLPLVPVKLEAVCVEMLEEAGKISKRGRAYALILADGNAFTETQVPAAMATIDKHPLLKGARRVLINSKDGFNPRVLKEVGFIFYTKPFLPEELAGLIEKGVA